MTVAIYACAELSHCHARTVDHFGPTHVSHVETSRLRLPWSLEILYKVAERLELEKAGDCDDDEYDFVVDEDKSRESENVQHMPSQFEMTGEDLLYWSISSDQLNVMPGKSSEQKLTLSGLDEATRTDTGISSSWADVMVTGSKRSNEVINEVRNKINQLVTQNRHT